MTTYAEKLMTGLTENTETNNKNPLTEIIKSGLGLVSTTENGEFALTAKGMAERQKSSGVRGGALVALDQQLVPSRPMMKKTNDIYEEFDPRVTIANRIHMSKRIGKDQGITRERLRSMFKEVIHEGTDLEQLSEQLADLVVLGFHVRDIDNGKGERQLFYWFLIELMQLIPDTVLMKLVPRIPDYGSWLDFPRLADICKDDIKTYSGIDSKRKKNASNMYDILVAFYGESLKVNMELPPDKRNLSGKWATRINSHFDKTCSFGKSVAKYIFPPENSKLCSDTYKLYRKMISAQTQGKCVETLMSDKKWREIADNLKSVSGKAMYKYRKAFRDEILYGPNKGERRHPDDEDRTYLLDKLDEATARAIEHPEENIIKGGKTLQAYEIVAKYINGESQNPVLEAQWAAIVQELKAPLNWANKLSLILLNLDENGVPIQNKDTIEAAKYLRNTVLGSMDKMGSSDTSLLSRLLESFKSNDTVNDFKQDLCDLVKSWIKAGKAFDGDVSIIDTSGSMHGTPMEVAISLGLLVAECQSEESPWRDMCITFSDNPDWHFMKGETLYERVIGLMDEGRWGGTTNFSKTMNMILTQCVDNKISEEFLPRRLWCFTDMQFNKSNSSYDGQWNTAYRKAKSSFVGAGYKAPPALTFWNIRSSNGTTQCQSDDKGVTTYGGFSQAMFKTMIYNQDVDVQQETPWDRLKTTLDSNRYMDIRNILDSSDESMIKDYKIPVLDEVVIEDNSDSEWEHL